MQGSEFKKIRTGLNLTQTKLSRMMGIKQNTISQWENETRRIPEIAILLLKNIEASNKTTSTPTSKPGSQEASNATNAL